MDPLTTAVMAVMCAYCTVKAQKAGNANAGGTNAPQMAAQQQYGGGYGGGVAGVTAAETIRANDQTGSIAIVSDEPYLLYSRVMLSKPNFFLGKVPFDQVWLKGEEWYKEKNISFLFSFQI